MAIRTGQTIGLLGGITYTINNVAILTILEINPNIALLTTLEKAPQKSTTAVMATFEKRTTSTIAILTTLQTIAQKSRVGIFTNLTVFVYNGTIGISTLFRRQVIHKPKGGLGSAESKMSTPTKGGSTSRIHTPTDGRGRF